MQLMPSDMWLYSGDALLYPLSGKKGGPFELGNIENV